MITNSTVGEAEFLIKDLIGGKKWITLLHAGKKAAEIQVEAKWVSVLQKRDTDVVNDYLEEEEDIVIDDNRKRLAGLMEEQLKSNVNQEDNALTHAESNTWAWNPM